MAETITIHVKVNNLLASYFGTREFDIQVVSKTSVFALLEHLSFDKPHALVELLLENGQVSPHLRVFVNHKLIMIGDEGTKLDDGDEVLLIPAISGG